MGQQAVAAPAATNPLAPKPTPTATPQPAARTKPKPPVVDAPVRAELAEPKSGVSPARPAQPLSQPTPTPVPRTPVVTASEDDVIGQMLLGGPAPAASGTSPPAVPMPAPMPAPAAMSLSPAINPSPSSPSPVAAEADPDQERRLKALLSAPASSAPAGAVKSEHTAEQKHFATAATQPAHQQAPPPPKPAAPIKKPKAPEIPVVCKLCGTRMYARPEQVGTRVRCPDCHSENIVPVQETAATKVQSAPSLDDGGDFALSEVTQRPAYRPIVAPRGDYAAIAHLDTSAPPRRETERPGQRPAEQAAPRHISTEMTMTFTGTAAQDDEEGAEIALSAPVERIETRQIVALPPPDDPDEDNQFRGKFRDEEWGFAADPREKDAWKKSPFYYGIIGFLFYPQTLYRLIFYSFVLTVDIAMFLGAIWFSHGETPLLFAALGLTVASSILSALMVGGASPCLVAITQDTANGSDAVENWPDWNIAEWLFQAMMIPAAALLAGMPGGVVASVLIAVGHEGLLYAPFPILLSELMFFPVVFGSMLAEGSFLPLSGPILASMSRKGDGWLLFYLASIFLGILLAGSMALVELGVQARSLLVAPFAAVLWVTATILYFRLLGRLLWYVQSYRRERDKPQ